MSNNAQNNIEISELGTNNWWIQQIQDFQNWAPGGVFAVFLGPTGCIAPAAAWFTTAAQLETLDRNPLFTSLLVIPPPGQGRLDYKSNFVAALKSAYANSNNGIPAILREHLANPKTILEDSNSESVVKRLEVLPRGSAIGICAAQRLRFNNLTTVNDVGIKAHTGFTVRNVKAENLTHFVELGLLRRVGRGPATEYLKPQFLKS
jgi:hypothetical protein